MGTPFTDIIDNSMITIRDYRIDNLIKQSEESFVMYMSGLLIKSIPKFTGCLKNLDYDLKTMTFNEELDIYEKNVLADLVVIMWFESIIQDITELNLMFQNRDQKTHSIASNLKSKTAYLNDMCHRLDKSINDYQNKNFNEIFGI